MGQQIAIKKPIEGINRDVSLKDLKGSQAWYMLNFERTLNNNRSTITSLTSSTTTGANEGLLTPVPANRLLSLPALTGAGFSAIRGYESALTKETYVWAFHDGGAHCIYRINQDLSLQVVYQGADLDLSDDPKHSIRGAHLFYINGKKYLVWVDGRKWQGFLDIETSIATNSFHVPYFQLGEFEQEQYWQLPTRPPMHCIRGEWITIDPDDDEELAKENRMLDQTWQFRYFWIYTDGRPTEWSPISTSFFVQYSEDQKDARGLPRCIKLSIPAGHPQVEKIGVAFRNCNGRATDETLPTDFQIFKTFDKYEECLDDSVPFWERSIREDEPDLVYNDDTNDFELIYCGEGECNQVDVKETDRTENPIPITSYALGTVENRLALLNNVIGYDQADCKITDKLKITLTPPQPNDCKLETAEIKVALIIHNFHRQVNQPIFTYGNDVDKEQKYFGGLMYRNFSTPFDDPGPYLQNFPDLQDGFIIYPEGLEVFAITKQFKDGVEYGAEGDFNSGSKRRDVSRFLDDGKTYVQHATLRVIKGTRGYLRVGGHRSKPSDSYRDTSTTVYGILKNLSGYSAKKELNASNVDVFAREIYFDTCGGNVDLSNTPFVVADLSAPFGDLTNPYAATAATGYVTDKNKEPVARAQIDHTGFARGGSYDSLITDHNGFYFASWAMNNISVGAPSLGIKVYVEGPGCTKVLGREKTVLQGGGAMPNETIEDDFKIEQVTNYDSDFQALVKLRVHDCRGIPLPGVPLVIKGYKASITNNSGIVSVPVRNRMFSYLRNFTETAVLMQSLSGFTICNTDCSTCMPQFDVHFPACFSGTPVIDIIDFTTNQPYVALLNPFVNTGRGLKNRGRYYFAPILHDGAGRHTAVPDETKPIDFPSVQQNGAYGFSTVDWSLTGPLNLPSWVKYMSIVRTANTAFEFMMQWAVNKITYVDSAGKETSASAADKIRFSIQALIDHNTAQLAANTVYEWVKGDRLTVISDDLGSIFATAEGLMDFLIESAITVKTEATTTVPATASYELVIPYDTRLKDLKEGALIEIYRPFDCETAQPYFELCDTIDVVDGEPVIDHGTLDTWDTYSLRRSIRWNDSRHIFPFAFEHHSPSDYWGARCDDRGRVFFRNPWAKQLHQGKSVYVSDTILENGNRNGLSTFRDESVKIFKGEQRGDITMCHSLHRALKIIFEHGNTVAAYADDLVRVARDGVARAATADEFLQEITQSSSNYGMQYDDPLACQFGNGWGMWVDRFEKAIAFDDGQSVTDITQGRYQGDFSAKLQFVEQYNQGKQGMNRVRLVMGFDPVSLNVFLTFHGKTLGQDPFIFNKGESDITLNETIGISVMDRAIFPYSFTPEAFGVMRSSVNGSVFFSFRNGQPWVHRERFTTEFNKFFGVVCDQYMTLVVNDEKNKEKLFLGFEQQTHHKYFVQEIACTGTDSRTQTPFQMKSLVPPKMITMSQNIMKGSFLFNLLSPVQNPLYNGEAMRGQFAVIRFLRDNTADGNLNVMDDAKRTAYSELDNILFLYTHLEQSAFNS